MYQDPGGFWSLRLASVGIWETGSERQPVQGPCHCTENVFPASPLLFSVSASTRSWKSRRWSPLPFLDLLCGFTVVACPLAPQHHDWKNVLTSTLLRRAEGRMPALELKNSCKLCNPKSWQRDRRDLLLLLCSVDKGCQPPFSGLSGSWTVWAMPPPPWVTCFLRSQWAPVIE